MDRQVHGVGRLRHIEPVVPELAFLAADELGCRSVPRDRCEVWCDTLTELDVRDTAFWVSLRTYHVDPNPAVCIVAGPPRATAGGSMRNPGTLSSWKL